MAKMFLRRLFSRISFPQLLLIISIVIVVFNEFLIYTFHRMSWLNVPCQSGNCTRLLLVADPQILGEQFDQGFFHRIAIIDSDRYLKNGFSRALAHSQPDVICFMGDLMDEGSVATSSDYGKYMERFGKVFPFDETKIEVMHIPGDNDIGGERTDVVTKFKVHRFEMAFKEKRTLDLKNFVRLLNVNLITHQYPTLEEYPSDFEMPEYTNIIVTHISLLSYMGMFSERITTKFKPNVIFSAHQHISRLLTYPPIHYENLNDNAVITVDLKLSSGLRPTWTEIMVPTCSYRMGEANIGFGLAVIDNNRLQYTVLWLPNRFWCLYAYSYWVAFAGVSLLIWFVTKRTYLCTRRPTYRHRLLIANDVF